MGEYFSKKIDADAKPIGVLATSAFGGICVMEIQHGIDDYIIHAEQYNGRYRCVSRSKLQTNANGRSFFIRNGKRYHMDEFLKA